jgi:phospholipase C
VVVRLKNRESVNTVRVRLKDFSYGAATKDISLQHNETISLKIDTTNSFRWYDFGVLHADEQTLVARFAGRVETGEWGFSDPAMGRVVGKHA